MKVNELIELLQKAPDKEREVDISINIQHGKEAEFWEMSQFSIVIR